MSLIQKITPINLEEEKAKFFADQTYNPQFIYREPISKKLLYRYGKPKKKYVELAKEIIDRAFHNRNELDLLMMEGKVLSQREADKIIHHFISLHHLDDQLEVIWSSSFVAKASITSKALKLRLPCDIRKNSVYSMLYHEVGTHALRRINSLQQPWYGEKNKLGFANYLKTEEGLAALHTYIPKEEKTIHFTARRYFYTYLAQSLSFAELYSQVSKLVVEPERRWGFTLRAKRGMVDTSLPGGFTKDIVYLEGMIDVWQYLVQHQYHLDQIYFGKIAIEDVEKVVQMNPNFKPSLPIFYTSNPEKYAQLVQEVAETNHFSQIVK